MSDTQDRSAKTEAPSARRLQQAREEGQVAKSPEVASFAALAAASAVILLGGAGLARRLAEGMLPFIAHPDAIDLSGQGALAVLRSALRAAAPAAAALGAAAVAGVAGNLAQHGVLFAPKAVAPDLSKIGFGSGLKRLFGLDNLLNFLKSLFKLAAMTAVVWSVLRPRAGLVTGLAWLDPGALAPVMMGVLQALMIASLLVFGASAGADYFVQRARFLQRMRMSREEVKREQKDTEGDPHIKARLKSQRAARAKTRMMAAVPKATLVVMNPTHYAVALRYVQGETPAPVCVAKGVDDVALRIRGVAEEHRVPVVEDPPLARALFDAIDLDETIPREHYEAVAKIVGFLMGKGRRARPARPR